MFAVPGDHGDHAGPTPARCATAAAPGPWERRDSARAHSTGPTGTWIPTIGR